MLVRRDLQEKTGIPESLYLVEDDHGAGEQSVKEKFRIVETSPHGRQVAIQVQGAVDHLRQRGFADAPYSRQPDYGTVRPGGVKPLDPNFPLNHNGTLHMDI